MWCKQCRQDVPAIVCGESGEYRCPRCAEGVYSPLNDTLVDLTGLSPSDVSGAEEQPGRHPPRLYDDWEVDDHLDHLGRVLHREKPQPAKSVTRRVDAAHQNVPPPHPPRGRQPGVPQQPAAEDSLSLMAFFTWTLLSLGLMTFVCGGVLLGWSIVSGREDLWTVGLPSALGGQVALLIGLILQLDRLWHDHRSTAVKLDRFDDDLHDLKATTTVLGDSPNPAGTDFYAHLAGGAGPHLLLTDLKGQLDLLAKRIGKAGRGNKD